MTSDIKYFSSSRCEFIDNRFELTFYDNNEPFDPDNFPSRDMVDSILEAVEWLDSFQGTMRGR